MAADGRPSVSQWVPVATAAAVRSREDAESGSVTMWLPYLKLMVVVVLVDGQLQIEAPHLQPSHQVVHEGVTREGAGRAAPLSSHPSMTSGSLVFWWYTRETTQEKRDQALAKMVQTKTRASDKNTRVTDANVGFGDSAVACLWVSGW